MKIRTTIDNINGRYNAQLDTHGFTAIEEEKIQEFGEPLIELGGSFSGSATRPGGSPVSVTFTLPAETRRLRSQFPAKHVFDLADSVNSDIMAKVWSDTIVTRLTSAKATLIALTSPFEGETVTTV